MSLNRIFFYTNGQLLKVQLSSFLPRKDDFIEILGKTYQATKVTIDIIGESAKIELVEVGAKKES